MDLVRCTRPFGRLGGHRPSSDFSRGGSISAWSVSRTTFFFWCMLKLVLLLRGGWAATRLSELKSLAPLFLFFSAVTLSLLPDFRQSGDYRYFFFGCAHVLMLVDVFSDTARRRWWLLPAMLGLLPLIVVARGFAHDPSILNFTLAERFAFPLDHANTAGYLFAMSIPLCVAAVIATAGRWRSFSVLSCAAQMFALVLTYSRGAWLGAGVAMLYLTAGLKKWKLLAALCILAAACTLILPSIRQRLATVTDPHDDQSLRNRFQLLASSVRLGMDNPVLGVGYGRGRLKEALRPHLLDTVLEDRPILHTHNVYVEVFAGTGLLGLLTFLWLIGITLLRVSLAALRRDGTQKLLGFALAASWIAAMVGGLGDIPFYHHETRIFFFSLLGVAHMYYSSMDKNHGLPSR